MSQGRVDLNQGTGAEGVVGRIVENSEEEGGRALFEGNKKPSRMRGGLSGQGGNRTPDTRIFSPLLYRLSYLTGCFFNYAGTGIVPGCRPVLSRVRMIRRDGGARQVKFVSNVASSVGSLVWYAYLTRAVGSY